MQNDAAEETHAKKNAITALKCYDNPLEYILDTRRSGMQNDAADETHANIFLPLLHPV